MGSNMWEAAMLGLACGVLTTGAVLYVGSCFIELYFARKEEFVQRLVDKKQGASNGKD